MGSAAPGTIPWQQVLAVYAEPAMPSASTQLFDQVTQPAMLGGHRVTAERLEFTPSFPLEPTMQYRAVFRPQALPGAKTNDANQDHILSQVLRIPAALATATTRVAAVHPSEDKLPENLLKFYIQFSGSMSRGRSYEHIQLIEESTRQIVELPFLELDEELWDRDMTRLTVLLDPGRIKRGVKPLVDTGPALRAGKTYSLVIDSHWLDAQGAPLLETHRKTFEVIPADRQTADPTAWTLHLPTSGTRLPIAADFGEAMDHALAARCIRVLGRDGERVEGAVRLEQQDHIWVFEPKRSWQPGNYRLEIQSIIEDLAGNNIGKPFDVKLDDPAQQIPFRQRVWRDFEIR